MSHYQLPRIHFRGEFRTNVGTCNNDDIASAFPQHQFVDAANVRVNTLGMTDAEFATWLRELAPPFGIRAGWNLYGDFRCDFLSTTVQSTHSPLNGLTIDPAHDSFIGAALELPRGAVMVDLDPEGTLGTQIFCDEFQLRSGQMRIGGQPTRFYSRDISRRNLNARGFAAFAANWFAAIPADRLSIVAGDSPVLAAFRSETENGKGLFIAFCTYLLAPRIPQQQLAQDFALGRATQNPAFGRVIGTMGIWAPDELTSLPVGRKMVPGAVLQHDHMNFQVNPARAVVDHSRHVVTVDLMNAIPEIDELLEKVHIGSVRLAVETSENGALNIQDIGDVAYDRANYEKQSGLVDVSYSPAQEAAIEQGRLVIYQVDTNAIVLGETRWTAESDDRCVYLQQDELLPVTIQLYERGAQPSGQHTVRLKQYNTTNRMFSPTNGATAIVNMPDELQVSTSGEIQLTAIRPGTCVVAMLPPGEAGDSLDYFINVRVLPKDDFSSVPDDGVTFERIYDEILRYYYLIFPAMSQIFDLSDALSVELQAQAIKDRIAKQLWSSSRYMPVTRDLSDGKRRLLERWCNLILGEPTLANAAET